MKKLILAYCFTGVLFAVSCNSERYVATTVDSLKSTEMKSFDKAFKDLSKPENKTNSQERNSNSVELSERRKRMLVPASIDLIKSTGVSSEEIQKRTNGDPSAIIVWAIQINNKKNIDINKKIKTEN